MNMNINIEQTSELEHVMNFMGWCKKHARVLILSVVLFVLIVLAIRYQQHHTQVRAEMASAVYEKMLIALKGNDTQTTNRQATELTQEFPKTLYAQFAHLTLAQLAIESQQLDEGALHLEKAIQPKVSQHIAHLARTRLARVYLAQQQPDKALDLISGVSEDSYISLYEEIKGDIYAAKQEPAKARLAYQAAINASPQRVPAPWLALKLSEFSELSDEK